MIYISLKNDLSEFLNGYEKLIIMGIGNELKFDDGVGPYIISELNNSELNENILLINALTVPENFTGKIRLENPSHIIIIDACLMGLNPGDVKIVNEKDFINIGISTHSMSLSFFVKYLEQGTDFKIIFVGIEPKTMDWGNAPTPNVQKAADEFIKTLKGIVL